MKHICFFGISAKKCQLWKRHLWKKLRFMIRKNLIMKFGISHEKRSYKKPYAFDDVFFYKDKEVKNNKIQSTPAIMYRNLFYKTFFICWWRIFPIFAAKLGHFIINDFFLYVTNTQTKLWKLENEEKKVLLDRLQVCMI